MAFAKGADTPRAENQAGWNSTAARSRPTGEDRFGVPHRKNMCRPAMTSGVPECPAGVACTACSGWPSTFLDRRPRWEDATTPSRPLAHAVSITLTIPRPWNLTHNDPTPGSNGSLLGWFPSRRYPKRLSTALPALPSCRYGPGYGRRVTGIHALITGGCPA